MITPYPDQDLDKKTQVRNMFNAISTNYDFVNHFCTLRIDFLWRKKAIRLLKKEKPESIIDIATGTADFAIQATSLKPKKIIGVDIAENMLEIGRKKIKRKKIDSIVQLQIGDAENLPFEDNTFDAAIVAFGIRNFQNLEAGLQEVHRILKQKSTFIILELSKPQNRLVRVVYNFYFKYIVSLIGRIFSKNKAAYTYLPNSVDVFPNGKAFIDIFQKAGFKQVRWISLSFGIASIYLGKKE